MKNHPRRGSSAFTLIELMAVITIMVILAGLVVGGMGFVNDRQAKEKAKLQIARISSALEDYKLDNGSYPATTNSVDGKNNSKILFKALYYDGSQDKTKTTKIYLPELDPGSSDVKNRQGWTSGVASETTTITDPWGNEYRYRTALGQPNTEAGGTTTVESNKDTQNPDFDLWCVGKDGKTNTDPKHKDSRDDIRNF